MPEFGNAHKGMTGGDASTTPISTVSPPPDPSGCWMPSCDGISSCGANFLSRGSTIPTTLPKQTEGLDMNTVAAEEWKHLSSSERQQVQNEVHGLVDGGIVETPELIETSLLFLQQELDRIPPRRKRAYSRAVFWKPSLISERSFLLLFLRADLFHAPSAAQRLCRYFEEKVSIFGEEALVRPLTMNDLSSHDIQTVCNGAGHLLRKDKMGRLVFFIDYQFLDYQDWKGINRMSWYMALAALEDEEVQKKGFVEVFYCHGALQPRSGGATAGRKRQGIVEHLTKGLAGILSLPIRMAGIHFCYDEPALQPIIHVAQMAFGATNRLRFRSHYGSKMEVQYELLSYGLNIPSELLNRNMDFKEAMVSEYMCHLNNLCGKWVGGGDTRPVLETTGVVNDNRDNEGKSMVLLYPGPNDVLLGKGRPCQEYIGNKRMNQRVDESLEEYRNAMSDKFAKTRIAVRILKDIHAAGGYFLERDTELGGWKVIQSEDEQDNKIRNKITQAFRVRNRPTKSSQKATTNKHPNSKIIVPPTAGLNEPDDDFYRFLEAEPGLLVDPDDDNFTADTKRVRVHELIA